MGQALHYKHNGVRPTPSLGEYLHRYVPYDLVQETRRLEICCMYYRHDSDTTVN